MIKTFWVLLATMLLCSGCLGVQRKEYVIQLDRRGKTEPLSNTSGKATIKYVNIFSTDENERDVTFKDFGELVSDYLEGAKLEQDLPNVRNVKKRLFVENNVLCGEISFDFDSLHQVRLYRQGTGPYMYYLNPGSTSTEKYESSNGIVGPDYMPVVFWNPEMSELRLTTVLSEDTTGRRGLVKMYRLWEASRE